jgi:ABC-type transporter Mla subunit MlaD
VQRIALILVAAFALVGCGGDESASESYADDVCSNLSSWVTDVGDTVRSLTDQGLSISRDDIQTAVDQTEEATDALANDLQGLGAPETEDGRQARSELDDLASELRQQLDAIQEAVDSGEGLAAIAAQVSTAISAAANAVNTTVENLRGLDPPGELRDAFENSEQCDELRGQLDDIRSGSRG